jgi:hypothetical protein
MVKDPSSAKFQTFLDGVSIFLLFLAQTVTSLVTKDFSDNYLSFIIATKLLFLAVPFLVLDDHKNYNKRFLGFRIVYDVLLFITGFLLMKYAGLSEICFVTFCTIILLQLSCSTICVYILGEEEEIEEEDSEENSIPQALLSEHIDSNSREVSQSIQDDGDM